MSTGHIPTGRTDSPIGDIAYLARSDHRVPALVALTERPRSRSELCELTGVSSSTIRRTLGEFEARTWVRKEGYRYVTTQLGAAIAAGMEELIDRVETERKVRHVWDWLPEDLCAFPFETWVNLTVTVAEPDAPYRPVNRIESLLQATDECRYLRPEVALMEPCLELLFRRVESGVAITLVDRPSCHEYFMSTYPERSSALLERENFTVLEHDALPPYGLGLFDERVAISCYERDSGTVKAVIDTDVPAVREWTESVYAAYESDARPLESPLVPE